MDRFQYGTRGRRFRRMLGVALGKALVGPQVVSLETTHHCNLRCSFCESHGALLAAPITKTREYVGGRMTMNLETIQRLAKELAEVGTDLVELSGKGDPIAHPQLTEIVRAIKGAGIGCALVTNATLAKPDLARTLVEVELDRLSVSLNSGTREAYLASNKRDLWEKATQFLETVLTERRNRGGKNPWVRITHVVSKENFETFEGMVRICTQLGVDEVQFYVMGELRESRHLQLDDAEVRRVQAQIAPLAAELDRATIGHNLRSFHDDLARRAVHTTTSQKNPLQMKLPCYEGWMFCVIGPDGVVVPCCYCEEEKLGNVFDQSFVEIWNGALYNLFRKKSLELPKVRRQICKECFTTCNRALENQRIHNRVHPWAPVAAETPEATVGTPGGSGA
ncbi:MAG: radical SAM protein [Candidatus Eisenbacteria bacterium]|nr:radical SAM protein [Candidatus Eisenbacteria bacterium]MCC7142004.1 radical SAM protein [Candidatus Eisenbacteria bacterium]